MISPLTIAQFAITAQCLTTAKALQTLRDKYQNASRTIAAICSESTVISASLSQLQSLLVSDANHISDHLRDRPELYATFDTSLAGCMVIYSCLDDEVQRLSVQCHNADRATWKEEAKFVWNEDSMKQLLDSLRGQQQALTLLIQVLQTESLMDIKKLLQDGNAVISQVANRSRDLRASHPSVRVPESIYESTMAGEGSMIDDAEFAFDDAVVNSQAYRRAFKAARRAKAKSPEVSAEVLLDSVQTEDGKDDSIPGKEPIPSSDSVPPSIEAEEERPPLPPRRKTPSSTPNRYRATSSNGRRSSSVASGSQDVRKTTLATVDDMQVRKVWDEILQSEILYVTSLRKLQSSFRDPISTQWPALAKHLEVLKLLDEMIRLNDDHLLTPLTDQLAKPLACANPMIFQIWYKEAGPTYRKYYERYPHAAAAIRTTIDVDSKFRKFVQLSDASAGRVLGLRDLLVAPMRQIEAYCDLLRKAASMSFSSQLIAHQTTDFMKTCQMLKRFKASSTMLLEQTAWVEEMQSLKRRISSVNSSFPEMLDIADKSRKIIYQGPVACKVKGKGSWTQVHAILLDNYLFWGTIERPRAHWGGKWKSGEKLWILEAPLSTTHLQCELEAKQEQAIKPSLLNEVPRGQEMYPFTVLTITAKHVLGGASRQQRQEWMDAIRSLRYLGVSNVAIPTIGAASIF
ncbi:hypothetical protein K490DRAFT_45933 [Saccharata proteae CBS 121410]|uniref:DH domain-containing protein n=1 Tax=Saccharata proteae CBS 121410 TaxID=1314787 RepID=A0A9P4LY93_9PEZI|nr:hypothetical protein K490DRAFT_45933 [Saccharata proteae CBS 121410]